MKRVLGLFTVVLALGSMPALASTEYYTHYDISLNGGQSDVTNLMLLETENGLTWAFSTNCGGGGGCTTEIDNPFGSTTAPTTALLVGLTNNGQDVVLITSTAFGASATGNDWTSLFPDTTEASLLSAIQLGTSGGPFCPGVNCINPPDGGLNAVFSFGGSDGAGSFFNIGDQMSVLEFSDGQVIGTGTSWETTESPTPPVPEPSTFLRLGSGLAGLTLLLRKKMGFNN